MSNVQEIESALSRLSLSELSMIERWICDFKQRHQKDQGYDYLLREYGVTSEEWQRFVQRREEEIESDRSHGRMKFFTGDIEQDLLD